MSKTLKDFNPSGSSIVGDIKTLTDEIIDYIEHSVPEGRERDIALLNYEQAAMWAVKANFVKGNK